ncbi:hypothetical protein phytr_1030 [Candidatus Phycorickettsia trachydisci]|uniref:Uncharacterized protein n=1 Tax=Candidatus Phycorickettsia trachydisci TaxID=2115978 RepID=A0A2P1P711_9RICK|nr:hypothetical protein phytr_1030 [Candidatus Phycorickettsia trachydisci]
MIAPKGILSDADPVIQDAYRVMKRIMKGPARREEYISAKLKEAELEREFEVCAEKGKTEGQLALLVSSISTIESLPRCATSISSQSMGIASVNSSL